MKNKREFVGVIVIFLLLLNQSKLINAEIFDPVIDGNKSHEEWSSANSYQVTFSDIDTKANETGTIYIGRGVNAYHLALEIGYPSGTAKGALAFAISIGEHEPHDEQIIDRKLVSYYYNLTEQKWLNETYDQNENVKTNMVQNETAVDVIGAAGISATIIFFEMSIPFTQTDSEPYDRSLSTGNQIDVIFTYFRGYYNETDNLEWGFHALSRGYKMKITANSVELIIPTEGIPLHFGLLGAVALLFSTYICKRKIKKKP